MIAILIRKDAPEYLEFLKKILAPFGVVADREADRGEFHHRIFALVVTTLRTFDKSTTVELDNGKVVHIVFEYYRPFARCSTSFALEHATDVYNA